MSLISVDGAIHRAAGRRLLQENKTHGGCDDGEAVVSGGYRLPAKCEETTEEFLYFNTLFLSFTIQTLSPQLVPGVNILRSSRVRTDHVWRKCSS